MKLRDVMTASPVSVAPEESAEVAARTLARYNIGALPVCDRHGRLCGMLTDRDLVTRCMASGRIPARTSVREVMTAQVTSAAPDMHTGVAAHLMGRLQVRRLPVVENGRLCGMVSLGDLALHEETAPDASGALSDISENIAPK